MRISVAVTTACFMAACSSAGGLDGMGENESLTGVSPETASPLLGGGALAASLLSVYLDQQAAELDSIPGAKVDKREDSILVHFQSQLLFTSGHSQLQPSAVDRMRSLARTLKHYPKSRVIIKGHTDSVGETDFNLRLSEERAERVRKFLTEQSVAPPRITAIGFGESLPVEANTTKAGRQRNRRVEVEIRPNDEVMRSRPAPVH